MKFGGFNRQTVSSTARKENQQPAATSTTRSSTTATSTTGGATKRTSSVPKRTQSAPKNPTTTTTENLPLQQKDPSSTPPERTAKISPPQKHQKEQDQKQLQQQQLYFQQLQQQHARNAKVISRLQTELNEWKQQRDTAQIVFMQENSALERFQKSLDQAKLRVERKKQMLLQYSLVYQKQQNHQHETSGFPLNNNNNNNVGEEASEIQQQSAHNIIIAHNISSRVSTVGTQVLPPQKRDVSLQCDTAIVCAVDFVKSLEISHRENLISLQQMKKSVVDSATQRNVELADEVADLVRRTQVIQRELLDQLDRFRFEKMSEDQIAVAERLVKSVIVSNGEVENVTLSGANYSASVSAGDDAIRRYLLSDVSMIGNAPTDTSFVAQHQDPTANARFLARDPSEAVYRTVERARLALSQALVKY